MKTAFFLLLTLAFASSGFAKEPKEQVTSYVDVVETETSTLLRTAEIRYQRGDQLVTLVGAIHIADAIYYEQMNKDFLNYDAVLYELVGGAEIQGQQPNAAAKEKNADPTFKMLATLYSDMTQQLDLSAQTEKIDYTARNFVHADISIATFNRLQEEKGGSLLGLALALQAEGEQPNMALYLNALLTKNPAAMKRSMVGTMASAGKVNALAGNSVIIGDRNAKAFSVLDDQLARGRQNIAIFYGAAHLGDMDVRLTKRGFRKVGGAWRIAWDIPK